MQKQKYDGVIFDLDGTLWDSVKSVVDIWNKALASVGIEPTMNYDELSKCMGLRIEQIFDRVIPQATQEQRELIKERCLETEKDYLAEHGGVLYENVEDTLKELQKEYRLFIVSNCQDGYIQAFFKAHGLKKYFEDYECAGRTGHSKGRNIRILAERNKLENPIYVGDTISDYEATVEAEVPFLFARYGFGDVENARLIADSFEEIKVKLKEEICI